MTHTGYLLCWNIAERDMNLRAYDPAGLIPKPAYFFFCNQCSSLGYWNGSPLRLGYWMVHQEQLGGFSQRCFSCYSEMGTVSGIELFDTDLNGVSDFPGPEFFLNQRGNNGQTQEGSSSND